MTSSSNLLPFPSSLPSRAEVREEKEVVRGKKQEAKTVRRILAGPRIRAEVRRLSGEGIRPETAFKLGKAIGAFHPQYRSEVRLAMLRALRVSYREMRQEQIPAYLRGIIEAFRAKGIPLPRPTRESGAQIFLGDQLPTETQIAALVFTYAMSPSSRGEIVIFGKEKFAPGDLEKLEGYQARLAEIQNVEEKPLGLRLHVLNSREVVKRLQILNAELAGWLVKQGIRGDGNLTSETRWLARNRIVVTMSEEFAERIQREDLITASLVGARQVRYGSPRNSFEYFPLFNVADSLSKKTYTLLSQDEQRMLRETATDFYQFNSTGIPDPSRWLIVSQLVEAQTQQLLKQAA